MDSTTTPHDGDARYENYAKKNQTVSEFDLRNNVIEDFGGTAAIAHSGDVFRRYEDGVWKAIHELEIEKAVAEEMEMAAAQAVIKPSYAMQRSITNAIRSKVYVREDVWNRNPGVLVFKNCALDTEKMSVLEHSPDYMSTTALPYSYDPDAVSPTWDRVLMDVLPNERVRSFFQEWAGYCLTTDVKHHITLWLVGPPGGGKSTLIAGLEAMLGDVLNGTLGLTQLQGSGSRFALSNVPGKTLLTCTENPRQHIKVTDVLNALITGDTLTVERKNKDPFDYRNTAKLMWAMNTLPGLYDPNNGLFRRVKVIEIEALKGKRDPDVMDRVRIEGPGILQWALYGLHRLNQRGHFDYPTEIQDATERFRKDNDLPGLFLEECCERTDPLFGEHKEYAQVLTEAYNAWSEKHGHGHRSTKALAPEWERLGLKRGERDKHGVSYSGVKVIVGQ